MNKTAIKNFAIWSRNKLIADVKYRAGLMGITEKGIANALPQSTGTTEFYDIGTLQPYAISGAEVKQREKLVNALRQKENDSDYETAYKYILEEVAYTWFNRLIAVRFMEVNDYLPSHIRVLSSESGKQEPDLVTNPFDANLGFDEDEKNQILQLKNDNKLDEMFRMLFIKQCNALNDILPALFETTSDYTELLLNVSYIDQEGVVAHLVKDIDEDDFNVEKGGQVEIIGWLYQYYNTELNEEVYDGTLSNSKIDKELIPAATTIYTPDWPIHYMVENSLGKLWIEGHKNNAIMDKWKYYLHNDESRECNPITVEEIKVIDPCMGSGHILVYLFDVLIQIYESQGYGRKDAATNILKNNLFGIDIDDRAFQMSYFAVLMKARQYNRRILSSSTCINLYSIPESNSINKKHISYWIKSCTLNEDKKYLFNEIEKLIILFKDAKEYGSILKMTPVDIGAIENLLSKDMDTYQISLDSLGIEKTKGEIKNLIKIYKVLSSKFDVVVTNPPYLGNKRFNNKLDAYTKKYYQDEHMDLSMVMYKHSLEDFLKVGGYASFITTSSWMTITSFSKLRMNVIDNYSITSLVDFGTELFEGKVGHNPIVAWTTQNKKREEPLFAVRLVDYCFSRRDEKEKEFFNKKNYYLIDQRALNNIDGCPITYWISDKVLNTFEKGIPLGNYSYPRQGLASSDNLFYLRLWNELNVSEIEFDALKNSNTLKKWFPYNKGGDFRKWYGNRNYVINWKEKGMDLKNNPKAVIRNPEYYFKSLISYSDVTGGAFSMRYYGMGFVFDSTGPSLFDEGKGIELEYIIALMNSTMVNEYYLKMLCPTIHYTQSAVAKVPIIYDLLEKDNIKEKANENINISMMDWNSYEISWNFTYHPFTKGPTMGRLIADKYKEWEEECNNRFNQLKANEEELNRIFIDIYGLQDELTPEVEDKDVTVRKAELQRDIKSLLSYAVGCMFGRYSLDVEGLAYAGGDWDASKYTSFIPDEDNVIPITDEEYLEDDIVTRLCEFLKVVYGDDTLEENLDFIAKALGNKGDTSREIIRTYFLNDFFKDHCQTYSVTGSGKRPIYWLFDSGKQNGFKALIYLHRYNADTIGNLRVDYLHRMQRVYESEINRMQDMIDNSTNNREVAQATKRKEKLTKQLKESRDYDEKIGHLALERIELDLDDGVKYNYRKLQTGSDGKLYEVLADSKDIMMDAKKYADFKKN